MFNEITLKNFRQHRDLTVTFENGVVALRGANEAGKTTLLEAIAYALGGADMLREPLPEVVTWGLKESQLKVSLAFTVNAVQYVVTRGKSGAEIRCGVEIKATGQREVTRYVETLLGCPIKTATQLMLANQQKLRGTLEEDGAAIKLIEQLANFAAIDKIIGLVQAKRPCGTTVSVEARIATLAEQLVAPLEDTTTPLQDAVEVAQLKALAQQDVVDGLRKAWETDQAAARDAQQRLDRAAQASAAVQVAASRLEQAKATLSLIKPLPGLAQVGIDALRQQVQDATRFTRAQQAWNMLTAVPEPAWEGSHEDLTKEHQKAFEAERVAMVAAGNIRARIGGLAAQRITQTACGLCGKDLSAVPEVVTKNAELDAQIAALEEEHAAERSAQETAAAERAAYAGVIDDGRKAGYIFQQISEFITLDHSFVPAKWTWIGPDLRQPVVNPAQELRNEEAKAAKYQQDLGRKQQQEALVEQLQTAFAGAMEAEVVAKKATDGAQAALDAAAVSTAALYEAEQVFSAAERELRDAEQALRMAKLLYEQQVNARKAVEDQLAAARKELSDMQFNNQLVTDLRKARPAIVEELWNVVSATVSTYFSEIRGTPSVFLRCDDSFQVDGRGIKGLSGSTLDALGLAIRMTLTKWFLPNTRFMVLDEPAAAADEDRETNMLGVIASSQFDQILLVTHSNLADSVASQVVRL